MLRATLNMYISQIHTHEEGVCHHLYLLSYLSLFFNDNDFVFIYSYHLSQ